MPTTTEDPAYEEIRWLAMYIAKYHPQMEGREDKQLYQTLVANKDGLWDWAERHRWESWRGYYCRYKKQIDDIVTKRLQARRPHASIKPNKHPVKSAHPKNTRTPFTGADDEHLVHFLAIETFAGKNRSGNAIYEKLVTNADDFWPWADRHTSQSWRDRYAKNTASFDARIRRFQRENDIHAVDVATPDQRQEIWEKLGDHGDIKAASASDEQRKTKPKIQPRSIAVSEHEPHISEKAKGKRRATDRASDEVVLKKRRVGDAISQQDQAERSEDNIKNPPSRSGRALSVPPIAVQPEETDDPTSDFEEDQLFDDDPDNDQLHRERDATKKSHPDKHSFQQNQSLDTRAEEGAVFAGESGAFDSQHFQQRDGYPSTSTPRQEGPPPASQDIPTPNTLELQAKEAEAASLPATVVQEPTPPISDSPGLQPSKRSMNNVGAPASSPADVSDREGAAEGDPAAEDEDSLSQMSREDTPSPPQRPRKPKRPIRTQTDDFFAEDVPAAPRIKSPQRHRARQLLVRAEGAFNSTLADAKELPSAIKRGARRRSGNGLDLPLGPDEDEQQEVWPPKRRKAMDKIDNKTAAAQTEPTQKTQGTLEAEDPKHSRPLYTSNAPQHPFSQPTQATSQSQVPEPGPSDIRRRVQVDVHHPFSQPSQQGPPASEHITRSSIVAALGRRTLPAESHPSGSTTGKDLGARLMPPPDITNRTDTLSVSPQKTAALPNRRDSVLSEDDAAISNRFAAREKGKQRAVEVPTSSKATNRRHTFAGPVGHERESEGSRTHRSTSARASRSPLSPAPVTLMYGDVVLDPRDHAETYKVMLKRAVRKTGFPKDVVHSVWRTTGSWTVTCEVLNAKRVQEQAVQAIMEAVAERSSLSVDDMAGSRNQSVGRRSGSANVLEDYYTSRRARTPPRFAPEQSPPSPAYVPPDNSRAAIYLRDQSLREMAAKSAAASPAQVKDEEDEDEDEDEEDSRSQVLDGLDDVEQSAEVQASANPPGSPAEGSKARIELARRILARRTVR